MTREELKAIGITEEHIEGVMMLHGKAMKDVRDKLAVSQDETATAREELKKYQQGGELYQDPAEIETLRKFKTDTEAEREKQTKDKAFEKLLEKIKVRQELKPLVSKMLDYGKLTLTDKGEVDEAYEKTFTEELKVACPTAFDTPPNGTGIGYGNQVPGTGANGDGKPTTPTSAEWNSAIAAKTKIQ